jgi:hypothetical protein
MEAAARSKDEVFGGGRVKHDGHPVAVVLNGEEDAVIVVQPDLDVSIH